MALEPYSGLVRAWIGGRDYSRDQFDHVEQARRQIGSTVKPFVYLTALDKELNRYKPAAPDSILSDRPIEVELPNKTTWKPENIDKQFRGRVTLRYALEKSLNVPRSIWRKRWGRARLPGPSLISGSRRMSRRCRRSPWGPWTPTCWR